MKHHEGREFVEYAVIAVIVALAATLAISGAGEYLADFWNSVTRMVVG